MGGCLCVYPTLLMARVLRCNCCETGVLEPAMESPLGAFDYEDRCWYQCTTCHEFNARYTDGASRLRYMEQDGWWDAGIAAEPRFLQLSSSEQLTIMTQIMSHRAATAATYARAKGL